MEQMKRIPRSPYIVQPFSTRAMMLDILVALTPAIGMAVFLFGIRVLFLCLVSIVACVGFETLYHRLMKQENTIHDFSACVTGLLLAMCLPATASYIMVVIGAAFAIVVVKQLYGGLGKNFMNPALAGRMLLVAFPTLMTTWSSPLERLPLFHVDTVSSSTPMASLSVGILPEFDLAQLLMGYQGGCLGEVSSFMLLLGGGYLILREVISPRIPLAFIGTVSVMMFFMTPMGVDPFRWVLCQVFSGGLILGAFFMATDPTTSPMTPKGQIFYGCGCGVLTVLLRTCSSYPEGVGWAILIMNSCVWMFDHAGTPRRYGETPFTAVKASWKRVREDMAEIQFVKPELRRTMPKRVHGMAPGEEYLDALHEHMPSVLWMGGTILTMGLLIFVVHQGTALDAVRAETAAQQKLLKQVMPRASFSSEAPYRATGALSIQSAFSAENELEGYCVEVQSQGFGGVITMVVGVDLDGKVTGVAITDHSETVSVVERVLSQTSLNRYVGRSGTIRNHGSNAVEAVSGATATSNAITTGVNRALAIVARLDTQVQVDFEESDVD